MSVRATTLDVITGARDVLRADATGGSGLIRSLRDQAVAAGRTIDLREYTNYAPWTFIVTG